MDDPQQAEMAPPEDAPARPLPHSVRGVFLNYIDYWRPRFFARPSARPAGAPDYGDLDFLPDYSRGYNSILDHCNVLLLYGDAWLYCVVNPATRRWERLPRMDANGYVPYLVFDPALSHGYEVLLFRRPEKPKKFDLTEFLSLLDEISAAEEDVGSQCQDEPAVEPLPMQSIDDLHRLTEWPPSEWTLPVFSSATGEWRERSFVREGEAVKTMASMQLDAVQPMEWGPRWRYSVYWRGVLYVHCRGAFVARLSLPDGKYRVFNTPVDFEESKHARPYLGKSEKGVYFATIHEYNNLLRVWNLNESSGPIDWVLKLDESTLWAAVRLYQHEINGPWILEDNNNNDVENKMVTLKENIEWNFDDDNVMSNQGGCEEQYGHIYFLGFHPYKEVIFLGLSFIGVAYHLNSPKVQYLGKLRPKDYCAAYLNGIYESFMYTPCMVGELSETPP